MRNDNEKVLKDIEKDREKESEFARKASSFAKRKRRDVEKAIIKINFKHSNDKPKLNKLFEQQPGVELMKKCDKESKVRYNETFRAIE